MPAPKSPLLEKFLDRISFHESGCWEWTGAGHGLGYGMFSLGKRFTAVLAHRWSYEFFVDDIPQGKVIDHLCRNRKCVNPDHLEPVTIGENVMRGETLAAQNAARTHCVRGHPFDEANTYMQQGRRGCRECRRLRLRKAYWKKRGVLLDV